MQSKIIELLENGGELVRDLLKDATDFRVITGRKVQRFPLKLLTKMAKNNVVKLKEVFSLHSTYKLVKN